MLAIIALPFVQVNAAGKTVAGFKNNSYASQGYSDAKIVVDGVYAKDSAYSKNYKEGYDVSQSDFFSKNHTIKYWSSHGSSAGYVYGDANDVSAQMTSSTKFSGGNLEFLFLCACYQLTGDGSNPRAWYANSMIGNNAVRVICGYHEQAPKKSDYMVAEEFITTAKTGESVKSSWMIANLNVYTEHGYTAPKDFLVLTHNNNSQYSRFEGFPGNTYSRPGSSSTSILRFSYVNQSGTNQPYSSGSSDAFTSLNSIVVPSYRIQVRPLATKTDISGEIGHTAITMDSDEALHASQEWLFAQANSMASTLDGITSSISPIASNPVPSTGSIVMAEVKEKSSQEVEVPIAHVVSYDNTYNGVPLLGDTFTTIIDDTGVIYGNYKWHEVIGIVPVSTAENLTTVDFQTALNQAQAFIQAHSSAQSAYVDACEITRAALVFSPSQTDGIYTPTWVFDTTDEQRVLVDCITGSLSEA